MIGSMTALVVRLLALAPAAAYGAIVGLSLGATGSGGSILVLPILVYLLGMPVHAAVGTSLAVVGGIAAAGFFSMRRAALLREGIVVGLIGIGGAIPGSLLARRVSGALLLDAFAVLMLGVAVAMWRRRVSIEPGAAPGPNSLRVAAAGLAIGFLTGLLGVGGGFLIVPTLVLSLGMPLSSAVPTSLLVIALNCVWGLAARSNSTDIDWLTAAVFLAGGIAGGRVGAVIVARVAPVALQRGFAVFVGAVGLFVGGEALGIIPYHPK